MVKLNDLNGKEWILFTKSWFKIFAKPRTKSEIQNPGKFPEELVEEFIKFFTHERDVVFEPFLGVGSTIVAAENLNRVGSGIELNKTFFDISKSRITQADFSACTKIF